MPAYAPIRGPLNGQLPSTIDGRWRLVDGYVGGVRVPEADLSPLTLTIGDGRFAIGDTAGLIVIDSRPRPGVIDMVATSGANRGRFVPAIFEYSSGVLRVCYDLSGKTRPDGFDSPPGTRRFVALYWLDEQ